MHNKKRYVLCIVIIALGIGQGALLYFALFIFRCQPILQVDTTGIDFGVIPSGAEHTRAFRITNKGNKNLVIKRIQSGCGCLKVELSQNTIPPNCSEYLYVTLNADEYGTLVDVFIFSNDKQHSILKLSVKATPEMKTLVEPASIDFGQINVESLPVTKSVGLLINQNYFEDLAVSEIVLSSDEPYINIDFDRDLIVNSLLDVELTLAADSPIGDINTEMLISDGIKTARVRVFGSIRGDIYALPQMLIFGPVNPHDNSVAKNVTVTSRAESNNSLVINSSRFSHSLEGILFVTKEKSSQNSFEIVFSPKLYTGAWMNGEISGALEFLCSTNNTDHHKIRIPILLILKLPKIKSIDSTD